MDWVNIHIIIYIHMYVCICTVSTYVFRLIKDQNVRHWKNSKHVHCVRLFGQDANSFTCWHWNGHLQAALFGRERVRVRRWVLALPLSLSLSQPISELVLKITQSFAKPMPFCREMWERARQQQQHQRHHIKVTQISRPNLRTHTHAHTCMLEHMYIYVVCASPCSQTYHHVSPYICLCSRWIS